jgi:hypothetical protein
MNKLIRNFVLSGGLLIGSVMVQHSIADDPEPSPPAQVNSDAFAGVWSVSATPRDSEEEEQSGATPFTEAVLFHNGQFSAAAFAMMGFSTSQYEVEHRDGDAYFSVTLTSDDRGTLGWAGRLTEEGFVGLLVWTRADGEVYRYRVVGQRQD